MAKKNSKAVPKVDPYLEGLMGKLLERLTSLEKKVDLVVSRTEGKRASSDALKPQAQQQPSAKLPRNHERPLYEAICANCSKVCEVPFKPTENRPVYCKVCWAERRNAGRPQGMPVLTAVAVAPKPASTLGVAAKFAPQVQAKPVKKAQKSSPAKKSKKKK